MSWSEDNAPATAAEFDVNVVYALYLYMRKLPMLLKTGCHRPIQRLRHWAEGKS